MKTLGRLAITGWGTTVLALAVTTPAWAMVPTFPTPDHNCIDVNDTVVSNGRVAGCFDVSLANARFQAALGTTGLNWTDIGSSAVPKASECEVGKLSREDGWVWSCVLRDGQHRLIKAKPWKRPVEMAFAHTASPQRSNLTVSSASSLNGCRIKASDPRLLHGSPLSLSGRSARVPIDTTKVRAGVHSVTVTCPDSRLNAAGDLLVRPTRSALLRSDCLDAWHDTNYAEIVPGYGRRMDLSASKATTVECQRLAPLTAGEFEHTDKEAYLRIAQIAEREVRRISSAKGLPICQAIAEVFKPVDTAGRLVSPTPSPQLGMTVPVAGYRSDGYFAILYREWADSPVAMGNVVNCDQGNQSLRLMNGTWGSCPGNANGVDPHQMFPNYVFVTTPCPPTIDHGRTPVSVCIAWTAELGDNAVGGTGKVFVAEGLNASRDETSLNSTDDLTYDCGDRARRAGQFTNVDVSFAPTLR